MYSLWMNINSITLMSHNIPNEQCIITDIPSTEESDGYPQLLQSHSTQFNNIMNPNFNYPNNSDNEANEVPLSGLKINVSMSIVNPVNEACQY